MQIHGMTWIYVDQMNFHLVPKGPLARAAQAWALLCDRPKVVTQHLDQTF
jgi:hypothetical protein